MKNLPIMEARKRLTRLPEELESGHDTVAITRRGKPVLAVMPWETYEAIRETLEIMGDDELMKALRKSVAELKDGKTIPLEKVKRDLGL